MRTSCLCSAFLTISCSNSKAVNKHLPELLFCLHCCFCNSNSVHQTQYMRLTRKARIGLCPTHICYERNSPQGFRCLLHQLAPWITAHQASLSITNSQSFLKIISIELVMLSNHLIFCHPLLLPPLVFPSIRELTCAKPNLPLHPSSSPPPSQ